MYKPKKIKLKSGIKWEVSFHTRGRDSKRLRRRFDKKIDAENFIRDYFKEEKSAKADELITNLTFRSEAEYWLKIRKQELTITHLRRAKGILDKLLKSYGSLPIYEVNNLFLAKLRSKLLKQGKAAATVNRWTNTVTVILNFSYRNNRIKFNPAAGFGMLKEFRSEMSFWEKEEVQSFLSYANNKHTESRRWIYIAYLIALNTGIRAGELWGLKVKDINFERNFINIERQLLIRDKIIATTKGKNIRKVPLNNILKEELKTFIQGKENEELIFQTQNHTPISHATFRGRYFLPDLKKSGVRVIRFHDLRHTALTLMVEQGINLKVVQSIAGHADIQTTMKYVHLLGDSIEQVANVFVLSS
ncbi:MAG: hypothetical protein CME62_12420 [Halobacteriovoraceae bacterium]|nr:hypothetical protein [Halobacteriovoraceae bacterium]|tara:strand:- start:4412 stop:5491 length:1080 start_codon:yes stop_codon:yes gene_type:complete